MAMKLCKECGTEVSKSAKICPKCGKKLKHNGIRITIGLIIIIIGIGMLISDTNDTTPVSSNTGSTVLTNSSSSTTTKDNTKNVTSTNSKSTKMTLEKFNKIKTGMTYKQVVSIIGEDGKLSTESSYGGQTMKIYYWYASNGISNATVSFMNNKVTAKSQIGLE